MDRGSCIIFTARLMVGCIHARNASQCAVVNTHASEQCCIKFCHTFRETVVRTCTLVLGALNTLNTDDNNWAEKAIKCVNGGLLLS